MKQQKMSIGHMFVICGAMIGMLIGSGIAGGAETIQYYTYHGYWGFAVGTCLCIVCTLCFYAFSYAGRTRGLASINEIFNFYAGNVLGKFFSFVSGFFVFACYMFMTSGFGNTLNQEFGVPIWLGCLISTVTVVVITLIGFKALVDVIGRIAPVMIVLIFLIGFAAAFKFFPHIKEGITLIESGAVTVNHISEFWFMSFLSVSGCAICLVAPFLGTLGHENRHYDSRRFKLCLIVAAIVNCYTNVLMGFDNLGNSEAASQVAVPNLLLARSVLPGTWGTILSGLFAILIAAAIFTTVCPSMWTTVQWFSKDEKSTKYRIVTIVLAVVVYIVCLYVPYQTLIKVLMKYCGYCGVGIWLVCIPRYFIIKARDKKNGLVSAE